MLGAGPETGSGPVGWDSIPSTNPKRQQGSHLAPQQKSGEGPLSVPPSPLLIQLSALPFLIHPNHLIAPNSFLPNHFRQLTAPPYL